MTMSIKKMRRQIRRLANILYPPLRNKVLFPDLHKKSHQKEYNTVASESADIPFSFMNYGYAFLNEGKLPVLKDEELAFKYNIQLYHHLTQTVTVYDKDVLEVGSGRGGGCYYLKDYLGARTVTGIDLSPANIELSNKKYARPDLSFRLGDAENLSCDDASYDIVVNVESSHCYPLIDRFFKEVYRVLRSGGFFLFTDFRNLQRWETVTDLLIKNRFTAVKSEDITKNVVESLTCDNERKLALINQIAENEKRRNELLEWLGCIGSPIYKSFSSGEHVYKSFVLQK
jgi:ubiquinone/menaquinone biosynthesis C-methylase UbiE